MNVSNINIDVHTSILGFFWHFICFPFIASAFMKGGRGSKVDRVCICSHICGGLTNLLVVSQAILTPVESQ